MTPRPRILLVSPPYSGHLHPLLGLGLALQDIADVRLVSTPDAVDSAQACGIQGMPVLADHLRAVWAIAEPGHTIKANPFRLLSQLRQNLALMDAFQSDFRTCLEAWPPDLVLADFTLPVAGRLAQRLGIPWWTAHPSPCVIESPTGPPAYFGGEFPAQSTLDRLRHGCQRRLIRAFKQCIGLVYRRPLRQLGFTSLYRADGTEAVYSPERILALGHEALEFPRVWPDAVVFVGPVCFTPPGSHAQLPPKRPGRPRVLVTLGTHLKGAPKALFREAARRLAQQQPDLDIVFTHGSQQATVDAPLANFLECAYVSYAEGLKTCDAVVHHAGAGVLAHVLQHGLPSLVAPQDFDQFDLAARLVHAGLAHPLPSPKHLAPSLLALLHDHDMRRRCEAFRRTHPADQTETRVKQLVQDWWRAKHAPECQPTAEVRNLPSEKAVG